MQDESKLSEQDRQALNYLTLAASVLARPVDSDRSPKSPWWKSFLQPGVLAAFVTVVIGGIMGNFIAATIQAGAKEREFQQAWMKARGDQALLAYKEYTDQEQEIVKRAYELIGGCISASDDLISLTDKSFAPGSHVGVEAQRTAMRKNFNAYDVQWSRDSLKLQLLMSYYHSQMGQQNITDAWGKVQEAVTDYMGCASEWNDDHDGPPVSDSELENACKDKKDGFNSQIVLLTQSLEKSRRYAWEGWESPDQLRLKLETRASSPAPSR